MTEVSNTNRLGVVIVAAGRSSRMEGVDKQVTLLGGEAVISHSMRVFEQYEEVGSIVLVMSADNLDAGKDAVEAGGFSKVIDVVAGGERRQDSVKIGLDLLASQDSGAPEFVAVHDGARPFIDAEMVGRGLVTAQKIGAGIAAVPVKDTIKTAPHRVVTDTPDRSGMWAVQTPQVFRYDVLKTAHEMTDEDVTDDASMVESVGGMVAIFTGSNDNIKITTPEDLELATLIYGRRSELKSGAGGVPVEGSRFGIGFDGHGLVDGGPLRLGGIDIEFDKRLDGHSDGDVLFHAVASSILGAAGLGDLGGRFPSSDERYAGFDSAQFIAGSARLALEAGWLVTHVDATVIAQRPRLASEAPKMAAQLGMISGLENSSINVKVTSTDHVGAIGAGEGIAAQAVATLTPATK
ncbi:MAG: 2-C-methyl-D-erythritol 4-phosphate cytidylyltransferase [Chloroflexi bacterium]|jgi:2-C-methyl-D-erythritol 4-phosphate cytidylyltransferase / 2-C-methyl-D-erythritol 2,4-cyclodiphosphate synthase|nr:2-C-methyl-D-erythritol 4-phosphate cytidylyltransferase [Chloroflexota bacterium]MBT5627417.1 2-C-methyl-D-erythritol 4-phosphate cytidylyltransferase [Chloroflexota bacterium]